MHNPWKKKKWTNWTALKFKIFCFVEDTVERIKRQGGRNIPKHISDKELV